MYYSYYPKTIAFFYIFTIIVLILFAGISPLLGFYLSVIYLSFNLSKNEALRITISCIAIFSCVFMISSRNYLSGSIEDDFQNIYLPVYERMASGQSIFYEQFTGGFEFLLPLYFKIVNFLLGLRSPEYIMASVVAPCLVMTYVWLEKYGLKNISPDRRSLCVASTLGLMVFAVTTQNMRQAVSCVFMLYTITYFIDKRRVLFLIFFSLAMISHTSAILVLCIFVILLGDSRKRKNIIAIGALTVSLFFGFIITVIIANGLLGAATYKLLFYASSINNDFELGYLKFLTIMCVAGYFFFSSNHKDYKSLLFYGTFIYFVLTPIPVLSHRLLLLLVAFLNGYLMFLAFYRISNIYRFIFVGYCIYRLLKQGPFSPALGDTNFMDLWLSYPWVGDNLFYYLR